MGACTLPHKRDILPTILYNAIPQSGRPDWEEKRWPRRECTMTNPLDKTITVVSGLPRSGTSMMMRMLDVGGIDAVTDKIREADVDNPLGYYEFEPVKKTKDDASWLPSAVGKSVKMVYLLLYDLPTDYHYRVVFMRRNLDEVIDSQNIMLERRGKSQGGLSRDQLRANFKSQLDKVYDWLDEQTHFDVHYVDYNEVLKDPEPVVAAVNVFLGGSLDELGMAGVVKPDLYRNRHA